MSDVDKSVEVISGKIENILKTSDTSLKLPRINYGPMCLKILQEFIKHHNLPPDLPVPEPSLLMEQSLSRIFDIMLHSMGKEKRDELLLDVNEYKMGMPACFRN